MTHDLERLERAILDLIKDDAFFTDEKWFQGEAEIAERF